MERTRTVRNIAIVLAIAAAVYVLPGGGRAASTFEAALWVAFAVGIAYFGLRLYREHRISLDSLGDRHRALLYGGVALGVFVLAARRRLWETGSGELLWFVLVACVIYALVEVFRRSRSY
ncbi:MAG: hypothetical protein JWO21_2091 [Solirubrobacterales bacterium]|jgi:hypothetical protein|nr:hypothetical protein [Solirubrobacterales bacterium]